MSHERTKPGSLLMAVKRGLDVLGAGLLLAVLAIPLLLLGLVLLLAQGRPVLHRQVRVGRDGKPFTLLKFRTMRPDAESATGPVWATADDPRCTALGRHLRRAYVDELPQLLNVLAGHMSLIGPRPERPHFVRQFERTVPGYSARHRVRPGMSGWAQVHGWRGDTDIVGRTIHDLWYVQNASIMLDLRILVRTVSAIFGAGADTPTYADGLGQWAGDAGPEGRAFREAESTQSSLLSLNAEAPSS